MGVQGVGHPLRLVGVHVDACGAGRFAQAVVHGIDAGLAAELLLKMGALRHAFGRHVGVQLERVPLDLERVVGVRGQCAVEVGLADIAPGADRVGEDVQADRGLGHSGLLYWVASALRISLPVAVRGRVARRW